MAERPQIIKPELFFGLVGTVGTDLDKVISALTKALGVADYKAEPIRLSELLRAVDKFKDLPTKYADEYIDAHMTAGDDFRKLTDRRDAVAILGVSRLRSLRESKGTKTAGEVLPNQAYIFRSLKTPVKLSL
jgi:hypothetical protein